MGYIYTMSSQSMIESYSDEALQGAIQSLRKAEYLGQWGKDRLADLEAEARRRKHKRRESAQ